MTTFTGSIPTIASGDTTTVPTNLATYRDALKALTESWTAYSPTWTAATSNPSLGNGSFSGSGYAQANKLVAFIIVLTMGSTTTYGTGQWRLTLPVAPTSGRAMFTMLIVDSGTGNLRGEATWNPSGYLELFSDSTVAAGYERAVGTGVPLGYATNDQIVITGVYQGA